MNADRFRIITSNFPKLHLAVIGDFCLDRYLEIDPAKSEKSIETGLEVHNVVNVRSQPGAAGTILNNLAALGIGRIFAVGFCGEDGEGWELRRALQAKPGVELDYFLPTAQRRTFTYTKPLRMEPGCPPAELNRLDLKNWTPSPPSLVEFLQQGALYLAEHADAFILMDQVSIPETGVVGKALLETIARISARHPELLVLADSRRGLQGFPPVTLKMNAAELASLTGSSPTSDPTEVQRQASALAAKQGRNVFVTLADQGIVGADPSGQTRHVPALPVRGEIDIVGAGDAVTANLTAALAAGAAMPEALEIAMAAASVVIHELGTTGAATVEQIQGLVVD